MTVYFEREKIDDVRISLSEILSEIERLKNLRRWKYDQDSYFRPENILNNGSWESVGGLSKGGIAVIWKRYQDLFNQIEDYNNLPDLTQERENIKQIINKIEGIKDIINNPSQEKSQNSVCFRDSAWTSLKKNIDQNLISVQNSPFWEEALSTQERTTWRNYDIVIVQNNENRLFKDNLNTLEAAYQDLSVFKETINFSGGECAEAPEETEETEENCDRIAEALEKLAENFEINCLTEEHFDSVMVESVNVLQGGQIEIFKKVEEVLSLSKEILKKMSELEEKQKNLKEETERINKRIWPSDNEDMLVPKSLYDLRPDVQEKTKLTTIPEILRWQFLQTEGMIGKFPRGFTIKDTEIDEEGDQGKEVRFPNISEALVEIAGLLLNTDEVAETTLQIATRSARELIATRLTGLRDFYQNQAIMEFLGFATKQRKKQINLALNPFVDNFPEFLSNIEKEIRIIEYNQDKEPLHFQELAKQINTIFAVTGGALVDPVVFKNLDKDLRRKVDDWKSLTLNDPEDDDNFDRFAERFETSWNDAIGHPYPTKPYGREYDRRPRVREIGIDGDAKEDIEE